MSSEAPVLVCTTRQTVGRMLADSCREGASSLGNEPLERGLARLTLAAEPRDGSRGDERIPCLLRS